MIYSSNAFSNCELYSRGYHTIATYKEDEKAFLINKLKVNYKIREDEIIINLAPESSPLGRVVAAIESLKSIQFGDINCPIIGKPKLSMSMLSNEISVSVPKCDVPEKKMTPLKSGSAFIDNSMNKLILPKDVEVIPVNESHKTDLLKVENNITEFLKNKFFRGGPQMVLSPNEFKVKSFKHSYFKDTKLFITDVTAASTQVNKKISLSFSIVFLSLNGVSWYIADSSYIDPCYPDYNQDEQYARPDEKERHHGWIPKLKSGYVYDNPDYPSVIKFETPHILYYLDFNKKFIVLEKDFGNLDRMTEEPNYGILDFRPELPERQKNAEIE